MKKVGIIGGAGFIGSHVTQQFLDNGFDVKVSTTDITKKGKYEHLKSLSNAENLQIEQLDVTERETLREFVKDCEILVHGGTPFQLEVKDPPSELFYPTIKGTEIFLEVISETPRIEKVVFIASVAVYNTDFPMPAGGKSATDIFNETDTPFMSEDSHPYAQAKFIANQTVLKFIQDHPNLSFEISSVSPVMVLGRSLSDRDDSTSTGIQWLFKNRMAPNDFIQMFYDTDIDLAIVDVRDVAKAIYKVAVTSGLHGKNYLLGSETYPVSDVSLMLNHKDPKHRGRILYQNDLAKTDLNIQFTPVKETLNHFYNL